MRFLWFVALLRYEILALFAVFVRKNACALCLIIVTFAAKISKGYTQLTSEVITGVSGISADRQVAAVVYYNPMGVASSTPWRGVNVVVTRYTDGSTVTAKVLR